MKSFELKPTEETYFLHTRTTRLKKYGYPCVCGYTELLEDSLPIALDGCGEAVETFLSQVKMVLESLFK